MADAGTEVGKISIKVTPDTSDFRRDLKRDLDRLEKTLQADVDVVPDTTGFRQRVKAETAGLKADVDLNVKRGVLQRLQDLLSNIKAPSFGSGINPAGYGAIFAGILAVTAPLMSLLTTSLLALPGLIAAVATPVGALMLGLDGLKAAAARLAVPFEGLKATMSKFTEEQFSPVFDKLGEVFPTLARSLPTVTRGMADLAQSFVDSVTSSGGMAKIEATIDNIGAALSKAAPGIGSFTDGLLSLAKSFSEKLPNLSDWFNGAGKSFSEWIERITADGTLSKAFDGLGGTLKTIAEALGSMASEGLKFMQDPSKIQDFNTALKNVGDLLSNIVTLSNELNNGKLFTTALPSFDLEKIKQDLTAPFTSADAPWRDYAASVSDAFNTVKATVTNAMGAVAAAVSSVGSQIAGAWDGVVAAAQSAWNTVVSTVTGAIASAVSAVVSGGGQILAEVGSWPGRIAGAVSNMGSILVGAGKALMDGLLSGIKSGLQSVLDFASSIADKIAAVKGPLPYDFRVLQPAGEAMMHGLDEGLRKGFTSVLDRASNMADELAGALGPVDVGAKVSTDWESKAMEPLSMASDFVTANAKQFASDIGIGGNGAISQALQQGANFAKQFVFNVGSLDEAIAVKNNQINKDALQYTRR
ncbi:phage tail protein [Mycolicibacterium obuense]|uniref:Tape measure protein n=1 Tax=Mycolicibacterium obuense TaxID=1807 RepID=A0A0J6VH25_9MYCO|nr:hypothetical protein [Mycolicibacterium obuense]KMO68902.1 hypothetical protein MOBUDSM44075_04322 [Mycolicibacterium obuense]